MTKYEIDEHGWHEKPRLLDPVVMGVLTTALLIVAAVVVSVIAILASR